MSPSKAKVALLYSPCNQQKISTFFSSYSPGVFQGCNEITALFVRQHIKHIQSEHMSQLNVKRCKARETDRDRQRQRESPWGGTVSDSAHSPKRNDYYRWSVPILQRLFVPFHCPKAMISAYVSVCLWTNLSPYHTSIHWHRNPEVPSVGNCITQNKRED